MFNDIYEFIKKLINILQYQNKELDDKILKIIGEIIKLKNKKFNQNIIINILDKFQNTNSLINNFGIHMLKYLSKIINITKIYNIICDLLLKKDDLNFIIAMINILDIFLVVEEEGQKICLKIQKNKKFFKKIFTLWSYNPISTLIICLISNNYLLSFRLALELSKIELNQDELFQLCQLVQLLESSLFNNIRIKLLNPYKNIYLIKTLYVILMLLPLSQAYNSLNNRLSSLEIILDLDKSNLLKEIKSKEINDDNLKNENVEEYIKIFNSRQLEKNNN
jgi:vacuole morphology and inheritance protein 14